MQILADPLHARVRNPHLFFLLLVLSVTALLLVAWTREVRYTWFGTLLNGKRERALAATS